MRPSTNGIGLQYFRNIFVGMALIVAASSVWSSPLTFDPKFATVKIAAANINGNVEPITPTRRIEVDLSQQRLSAWEGDTLVYSYRISTGKRRTPTPIGRFRINSKYRINRMRGRGYDISDVPYAMYFYRGYAIHGAYWHNNFGTPVSHGCVNLRVKQARQLYKWAKIGTLVVVRQ
ncbi:L,D-transpeptidase [Fortiea contorta]|uniref:L,D-transpeptidase n=1 Tax=Fortiea contorta TaxID=1892405 RepID=UPI000381503B|nr:L,D-transpeptidase [Fortiea contorta]